MNLAMTHLWIMRNVSVDRNKLGSKFDCYAG